MADLIDRYAFLYPVTQENVISITDVNDIYKLFKDPVLYKTPIHDWELICDGLLGIDVQLADYDIFWELIYKLKTDESFYLNHEYLQYGAIDVELDINYIEFVRNEELWHIHLSIPRLMNEYPMEQDYLIFYDEDRTIQYVELYNTLNFFLENMGRDNNYIGFASYETFKGPLPVIFFIFYSREEPSQMKMRQLVRDYLTNKYGYEEARELFPILFVNSTRKIFLFDESRGFVINYNHLKLFIDRYGINHPEVIYLLDWICPLVIEYGLSDVVPNYSHHVNPNSNNTSFIYYLSKVLNYLQGRVFDPMTLLNANFYETDEYAAFVWGGIEWQVMRVNYYQGE